ASAGHVFETPSQLSAMSHGLVAGRQIPVLFASAGQLLLTPSQFSARSHGPAAGRQTAVLFASAGQSLLTPSQLSVTSHVPAAGGALAVRRTGRARSRAVLGRVAHACRGPALDRARQEAVRWAVVPDAVAVLGGVAGAHGRAALGVALDVGGTGRVRSRAG